MDHTGSVRYKVWNELVYFTEIYDINVDEQR